jgi:hypothetical protein
MFGTDKVRHYLPDFSRPRPRQSNVWQHLRSFKKQLFDCLPEEAFLVDSNPH